MSDYEKNEADRKQKEERKKRDEFSVKERLSEISRKGETDDANNRNKEVDYNALDYEENENQTDDEHEVPQRKVSSLVQYPALGSFQANQQVPDSSNIKKAEGESELVGNTRSEVLAMALGVQIKTGEDPPTGDITISGYDKKNKRKENDVNYTNETNGNYGMINNVTGQSAVVKVQQRNEPAIDRGKENQDGRSSERNKFESEKPMHREVNEFSGKRDRYRQPEYRRRDDYNRRPRGGGRMYNYRGDRYNRDRRMRRSPRRSRERRRSRSRRHSPLRRSRSPVRERSSKSREVKIEKSESEKKEEKRMETEAEKFKRRTEQIMLLKKKMELEVLEMKKRKEEEEAREKQVWLFFLIVSFVSSYFEN